MYRAFASPAGTLFGVKKGEKSLGFVSGVRNRSPYIIVFHCHKPQTCLCRSGFAQAGPFVLVSSPCIQMG